MNRIRALIADDEPLARRRIEKLLAEHADIEVVGQCSNGLGTVAAIVERRPDLVFLDVQMPDGDGFQVIKRVGPARMPMVIFVTAFDQHALRAFETGALHYLLKPFDARHFADALDRARQLIAMRSRGEDDLVKQLRAALAHLKLVDPPLRRLAVRDRDKVIFVPIDQIDWIEARGKYVYLHGAGRSHLLRESISRLERLLDPRQFARIHRSTIVNIDRIAQLEPAFQGEWCVRLRDGGALTLSRRYRNRVRTHLAQGL